MTLPKIRMYQLMGAGRYVSILSGLIAFGYFGHQTHWTFTRQAHGEQHSGVKIEHAPAAKPVNHGAAVEFASSEAVRKSGIDTASVQRRTVQDRVKATGVITYDQRQTAQLSSRVSGTVWRVTKQPGDSVKKGDTLLIIDAVDVGRVKTKFLSDLVDVESKTEFLANVEKIKAIGVGPERQVREARIAVREARLQLLNAEQTLVNYGLCVRAADFASLDDATRSAKLQFLGLPVELVADLDPTKTTSNLLPVIAPFDGEMIGEQPVIGESVEAGKPVVELANVNRMWVNLNVPKEDAAKLNLGQAISFTPDGSEEQIHSQISWISTAVDEQTRTLRVRADVENAVVSVDSQTRRRVHRLRANAYGEGTILIREATETITVPEAAVINTEEGSLVFVQTSERSFLRHEVRLGIHDGEFIQILSDVIKPGQRVVTQGNHVLKSELILNQLASSGS